MADATSVLPPAGDVREVAIIAAEPANPIGEVSEGDTWAFRAAGRWRDGYIPCGPSGYHFLPFDALAIVPQYSQAPWFSLVARFIDDPDSTFKIGEGAEITFQRSGSLVAFANDRPGFYGNNHGALELLMARLGRDEPPLELPRDKGDWIHAWHAVRDVLKHTAGMGLIALISLGVSYVLVFMTQGQDLSRGVGESGLNQPEMIVFALSLLFLAAQAWTWGRLIVVAYFGDDRTKWAPWPKRAFLEWSPRGLGAAPVFAAALSLYLHPARHTGAVIATVALGLLFIVAVWVRKPLERMLGRFALVGRLRISSLLLRRIWVLTSLAAVPIAMIIAYFAPVGFGHALGPAAVVFVGLGLILPVTITVIQIGAGLRIPVVIATLIAALVFSLWVDNHAIGRRQLGAQVRASINQRLSIADAFATWKAESKSQPQTIFLIAAQGGASRAAYWTAAVLAHLNRFTGGQFARHVFAINSVSGGSVGSVGFVAELKANPVAMDYQGLLNFVGRDALGPALTGLMFTDLLQRFVPFPIFPDRAEALERSWESAWMETHPEGENALAGPFLALAPHTGEWWRPLLIVQGASERTGRRLLTSGFKFEPREIDAEDVEAVLGYDVAASTAILNGARFPWVSPAGTFKNHGATDHIVDGGYFDNSGAEAVRELARTLRTLPDGGELRIVKIVIGFDDTPIATAKPKPHVPRNQFANDVVAPVVGLFGSMDGHESHLVSEASRNEADDSDYTITIMLGHGVTDDNRDCAPPMDWTLSHQARSDIEAFTGIARQQAIGEDYLNGPGPLCRAPELAAANCAKIIKIAGFVSPAPSDVCDR